MEKLSRLNISDLKAFQNLSATILEYITLPILRGEGDISRRLHCIISSILGKDIMSDSDRKNLCQLSEDIGARLSQKADKTACRMLEEIRFLTRQLLASSPAPLEEYQKDAIVALNALGPIRGKIVLEAAADLHLAVAKALIALGAAKVIAVNPAIPQDFESPDPAIVLVREPLEELQMEVESVDSILGIAILEHANHPAAFAAQCEKLLKKDGSLFLTGGPMWTSHGGHHIWLPNLPSGRQYYFNIAEKNPFEPWEHLNFANRADAELALKNKNIPDDDIPFILDQLFLDNHISRLTPTQIETVFKDIFGDRIKYGRWQLPIQKNRYFFEALANYSQEDLLSWALIISISSYNI